MEQESKSGIQSAGFEEPSDRAELVIILRNVGSGERVIWQREDDREDDQLSWLERLIWQKGTGS